LVEELAARRPATVRLSQLRSRTALSRFPAAKSTECASKLLLGKHDFNDLVFIVTNNFEFCMQEKKNVYQSQRFNKQESVV
jgi:hypothetical protein